MLTRTVADTAAMLDVLAGYEPGDATWAPPPPEPFAAARAREPPAACGSPRRRCRRSPTRSSTRCARGPSRDAAELLRSLGHEVEEVDPPWRSDGLAELFGAVFSSQIALSIAYSARDRRARADRRGHGADELGDLLDDRASWARSRVQVRGDRQLQAFARRLVSFLEPYDALLTPALAQRPLPIGTLDTAAPEPMATFTPLGPVHAVHARRSTPPASRRSRCRCSTARTGCRSACSSSGARPRRGSCWRSRRSSSGSAVGGRAGRGARAADRPQPPPSTAAIALRLDAERLGVGGAAGGVIDDLHQLGLVPGRERARAASRARAARSARETIGVGTCTSGRRRLSEREHACARSRSWLSVSGPGELVALAGAARRRAQRRHHAVGDVLGPDRLEAARARARRRASRGSSAQPLEQRQPRVAGGVHDRRREHDRAAGRCRAPPARRAPWRAGSACGAGCEAPSAEKKTKRSTPWRCAPPRPCARSRCR